MFKLRSEFSKFKGKIPLDAKIGSVVLIFFIFALLFIVPNQIEEEVGHHYQSPRLYPELLIGLMILLSALMIISSLKTRKLIARNSKKESSLKPVALKKTHMARVCITILTCFIYIWILVELLGFFLSSLIVLAFLIRFYGYGNRLILPLVAGGIPVVVYYIFKVSFQMPLPLGYIFK